MQSLTEIKIRAPAVGATIGVFLYVTLGLPARGGRSSNKYCVTVYGSTLLRFSALFENGLFFQNHYLVLISLLGGATIFAKLRSKIVKSLKIGGKDCAHQFV